MREAYTPELRQSAARARRRAALDRAARTSAAHLEEAILRHPLGYAALLWSRAGLPLPPAVYVESRAAEAAQAWSEEAIRLLDRAADRRRGMGDALLDGIHVVLAALDDPASWTSGRAGADPEAVLARLLHLHRDGPPPATRAQVQDAMRIQRERGGPLEDILVELGHVRRHDLPFEPARRRGLLVVDLDALTVPSDVIARVPAAFAREWQAVPIAFREGTLFVALADAHAVGIYDDLQAKLDCKIRGVVADPEAVARALARYYGDGRTPPPAAPSPIADIRRLVSSAVGIGATDLHLERADGLWTCRCRLEGVLQPLEPPTRPSALVRELKALSGMDPDAKLPDLGWFTLETSEGAVEVECSSLPTLSGESVVLILPPPPPRC